MAIPLKILTVKEGFYLQGQYYPTVIKKMEKIIMKAMEGFIVYPMVH